MKKLIFTLFALAATCLASSANEYSWTAADQGYENAQAITSIDLQGVATITFDKGTNNNPTAYYNSGKAVRMYGGNVATVTANDGVKITALNIVSDKSNILKPANVSDGAFTTDGVNVNWEGEATEFSFAQEGTKGNGRIVSFTLVYEQGEVSAEPSLSAPATLDFGKSLGTPAPKALTVNAKNLVDPISYAWKEGGIFDVEGELTQDGGTLTISLDETAEGSYEDVLILSSTNLTAEVVVTAEIVAIAGSGEGTEASPYDAVRAIDLIAKGAYTSDKVYVAGKITKIDEVSAQYGNATYYIGDENVSIQVFRGYSLNGDKFTAEDEIKVGDEVVVYGNLTDYVKDNVHTYEITNSKIITLNGASETPVDPEPVEVEGEGTVDVPYTVADVKALYDSNNIPEGEVWVVGYILGSASSATALNSPEKAVDTNIALGATPDAETFIPVELTKSTTDLRESVGVLTNPDNVGKLIKVYGKIEKYFSTAGVKSVTNWDIDTSSAITSIEAEEGAVRYFNLQGIEVANPTSGNIYIRVQGGKATKVVR